jgi:alanine dehydrogenase
MGKRIVIGVPKEIKISENRVGLTEAGVKQLVLEGHTVLVQKDAGLGSRITNEDYERAGAKIEESAKDVYGKADMIMKVKEPLPDEYELLRENQILYTYLHLAAEAKLTKVLMDRRVKAIAYETIQADDGSLPLLTPMSEVAGRMASQIGAYYLQKDHGGKGKRLEYLDDVFQGRITTLHSNTVNIENSVMHSDLVVGAVLVTGWKAPILVTKEMIERMQPGSVVVDVAVDQGGCIETCRPTSHQNPTYEVSGVIHYCVPNMPGVVSRTSTYALTNATFKYGSMLAAMGVEDAIAKDKSLFAGLNVYNGHICYEPVAKSLDMEFKPYRI